MNFLLDTHILIWAAISPHKISSELASLLSDPSNHLYFSSASIWEISIKESLGKRDFKVSSKKLHDGLIENGYKEIKSLCFTCDGGHKTSFYSSRSVRSYFGCNCNLGKYAPVNQ